jgi:serine/threonine-protein kinase
MAEAARAGRLPDLDKYEVVEEIGHGGMATVYRARDRRLGREVAVKIIHPHLRDSREVVLRFNTEAKAVAKLRHPNIVEVYDVSGPDDAEQYLVVELVRGTTLRALLAKHGALPPEIAVSIAILLLDALAHAHASGVVHRDIKPENVLISLDGWGPGPNLEGKALEGKAGSGETPSPDYAGTGRVAVKLTDFGIAKLLDAQGVTSTGQVLGSPAHMAPEQIEGGEVDGRSDVFGLGVLLYECLVGHLPFEGQNPAQVLRRVLDGSYPEAQVERPAVGTRWSKIVDRALAHAQGDRYPDAAAMKAAIVAELDRLAFSEPTRELGAWLDDPDGYREAHTRRMIDRLRSLGDDARKKGKAIDAAVDYNRALAHAPDDPQLLRIVTGMSRAEALRRQLRRAAQVGVGLVVAGAVAMAIVRFVHHGGPARGPTQPAATGSASTQPGQAEPTGGPVRPEPPPQEALSTVPTTASVPARTGGPHIPLALGGHDTVAKVTSRVVTLDLKPAMGVSVSVDGAPPTEVASGATLTLDAKGHALELTCPRRGGDDPCVATKVAVPPGETDETLSISVPVKPATLVIAGDLARTYQITQHPEIALRVGANTVPLRSAYEAVTVLELETGKTQSVRLEAGRSKPASF